MRLDINDVEAAVLDGAVLGGGGGGSLENGRALGAQALKRGSLELHAIEEIPADSILVTCSYVGSPAAEHVNVQPKDYLQAVRMLRRRARFRVGGLITNECGGTATVNGWLQAASLGLPLVDAPCNGRAHPTGLMGAMGLHTQPDYISHQAAVGGAAGRYVELYVQGTLENTSTLVRQAAVQAGGMVAVARNPVKAGYVRRHGAPGAIRQCIDLGHAMLTAREEGGLSVAWTAAEMLGGRILGAGTVGEVSLRSEGGFDVGQVRIGEFVLDFWNEYMTLERNGERLATFPDLIMTLAEADGNPVTTAEVREGQQVLILQAPHERLILGAGMRYPELFAPVEWALGKTL